MDLERSMDKSMESGKDNIADIFGKSHLSYPLDLYTTKPNLFHFADRRYDLGIEKYMQFGCSKVSLMRNSDTDSMNMKSSDMKSMTKAEKFEQDLRRLLERNNGKIFVT